MKRILTILLLLLGISCQAQIHTTNWPYLYNEFMDGTIIMESGKKSYFKMNIHLSKGRLHYIEGGIVKEANSAGIASIIIGEDEFSILNNNVMKVMAKTGNGYVAGHITLDLRSIAEPAGAYGTSTTSAAKQKFSSIDIADNIGMRYVELRQGKEGGESLDTECSYYIVCNGKIYPAKKKEIENSLDKEQKDKFKAFIKQNRIKWRDPDKLVLLIDFINEISE